MNLTQMTIISTTVGRFVIRNRVAVIVNVIVIVNKRVQNAVLVCNLKNDISKANHSIS